MVGYKVMQNKCVYIHSIKETGQVFYVGMGSLKRSREFSFSNRNKKWIEIFKKHGKPNVHIILENLSFEQAIEIEKFLIKYFGLDNLSNISPGDECLISCVFSEMHEISSFKRIHSEETRKLIGSYHKGKIISKQQKEKISKATKGVTKPKFTKLHRDNIASAKLGERNHRFDKTLYKFNHDEYGIQETTAYALTKQYNLNRSALGKVISGKYSQHKGWRVAGNAG